MDRVLLFGAGRFGELAWSEISKSCDIAAFVDNDPGKQGGKLCGLPIVGPEGISALTWSRIIITSTYADVIGEQLFALGIAKDKIWIFDLNRKCCERSDKPLINFYIDVFGYCNLRCPACPVGNWTEDDSAFTKGIMDPAFFAGILDKAASECRIGAVGLYNWTEPLLNPRLPEIVRIARQRHLWTGISSNLNILKNATTLLEADPTWFRVSVSGFTEETYRKSHAGGSIETVKANMVELAAAKSRTKAETQLQCFFHKYVDNEEEEALMKAYAEDLGFTFSTGWAYLMPVEKLLSLVNPAIKTASITPQDQAFDARLALRSREAVEAARSVRTKRCDLLNDFLALDVKGDVFLCCAASGAPSNRIGNYLDLPFEEIQARKKRHRLCGPCMQHNLADLYSGKHPALFDAIGNRIRAEYRSQSCGSAPF